MKTKIINGIQRGLFGRSNAHDSTGVLRQLKDEQLSAEYTHDLIDEVSETIRKTQLYYISQRNGKKYWWFELESNVTITSEYLILLHFLGIKDKTRDRKIANHILKHQRNDGTWAINRGRKGDLSITVEAYFALKLAGLSADDPSLRKAREFILTHGGIEGTRVFTKIFLALFGEFDWRAIPSMPVEIMLLPPWMPFNIYDFSSWARATIVPLLIVFDNKPIRPLPENARVQELYKMSRSKRPRLVTKPMTLFSWKRLFLLFDRLLKNFDENSLLRLLRRRALLKAERWILEHQEPTGDWAGIQPPMIKSILALSTLGYDISHQPIKKGLEALERFIIESQDELRLQPCISPLWDTALTSLALYHSGIDKKDPLIMDSCKWLASKQIFKKGDWSVKRPELNPGGWAFEFDNNWYPDIDDTAVILTLLNRYRDTEIINPENMTCGINWILGMQGKDGGWGAFDVDNNRKILNHIPFGDLEALIDPSTPDLTGRVLEVLGVMDYKQSHKYVQKAINFLKRTQEKDGSWWGRWGVNYLYGTWSVLVGLRSIGEDMTKPYIKKAVRWLKNRQNLDDGWGECCESYESPYMKVHGTSTPSQTAWTIMALIAAGEGTSEEVIKGIKFLIKRQNIDGTWDEEEFTGTGFPKYFMLRYHNYRNCFPLMALGMFISQFSDERVELRP
jgi:squalene-hopene/tetraprenyl-beta-curcumene cyclase